MLSAGPPDCGRMAGRWAGSGVGLPPFSAGIDRELCPQPTIFHSFTEENRSTWGRSDLSDLILRPRRLWKRPRFALLMRRGRPDACWSSQPRPFVTYYRASSMQRGGRACGSTCAGLMNEPVCARFLLDFSCRTAILKAFFILVEAEDQLSIPL